MTTMTIRCDEKDKRAAQEVAEYYGFDLSSVTRAFWKQMARTHAIPLELNEGEPNEESLQSVRDAEAILANGGRGFKSAREMLDAALAE